jgi:hypothetical protein
MNRGGRYAEIAFERRNGQPCIDLVSGEVLQSPHRDRLPQEDMKYDGFMSNLSFRK